MSSIIKMIKNEPRVGHIIVAKNTNNNEKSILDLINRQEKHLLKFGKIEFNDFKSLNSGRPKREYYLNKQQATLLITFMRNNEIVINFKIKLVSEFFKMRESLTNHSHYTPINFIYVKNCYN